MQSTHARALSRSHSLSVSLLSFSLSDSPTLPPVSASLEQDAHSHRICFHAWWGLTRSCSSLTRIAASSPTLFASYETSRYRQAGCESSSCCRRGAILGAAGRLLRIARYTQIVVQCLNSCSRRTVRHLVSSCADSPDFSCAGSARPARRPSRSPVRRGNEAVLVAWRVELVRAIRAAESKSVE